MSGSVRSLRAKLSHAERNATTRDELNLALLTELTEVRQTLAAVERDRDYNRGLFQSAVADKSAIKKERDVASNQLSELQNDLGFHKRALRSVEAERDAARAHAEAMRQQAFPQPPRFPWENA